MDKKTRPVLVTLVSGSHAEGGEKEELIRLRCQGELRESTSGYLLKYQEVQTDEDSGVTVTQDVILSLQPDRVTMNRLGAFGTTMVFMKDRRFEGAYHTPYGDLGLALYTTQVSCRLGPENGSVHLEYQLDMQGSYAAVQTIDVTYAAEEARTC